MPGAADQDEKDAHVPILEPSPRVNGKFQVYSKTEVVTWRALV